MVEASAFGIHKGSSCDTVAVKMLKGMGSAVYVWGQGLGDRGGCSELVMVAMWCRKRNRLRARASHKVPQGVHGPDLAQD